MQEGLAVFCRAVLACYDGTVLHIQPPRGQTLFDCTANRGGARQVHICKLVGALADEISQISILQQL